MCLYARARIVCKCLCARMCVIVDVGYLPVSLFMHKFLQLKPHEAPAVPGILYPGFAKRKVNIPTISPPLKGIGYK